MQPVQLGDIFPLGHIGSVFEHAPFVDNIAPPWLLNVVPGVTRHVRFALVLIYSE